MTQQRKTQGLNTKGSNEGMGKKEGTTAGTNKTKRHREEAKLKILCMGHETFKVKQEPRDQEKEGIWRQA